MTLIKSISGIRGTLGGRAGECLSPVDIVKFTAAFGSWSQANTGLKRMVIGRDARSSGEMVSRLVAGTLQGLGLEVIDLGLSTTPTVELAVVKQKAAGGIIVTASHNPANWNALKLLNHEGEFISAEDGAAVLGLAAAEDFHFAENKRLGQVRPYTTAIEEHIAAILRLELVDRNAIAARDFRIAVDCVNSTGGISIPQLLRALGLRHITEFFCEPNGQFPHNPEPLPENMIHISNAIREGKFDLGIVVDPDVDRLALICENGEPFGEEYTLVAVADYVLQHQPGNAVSNLSSTQALRDITLQHGGRYEAAAVGEVNVVRKMKECDAVIGGEGNGGVIYPKLHYGRDALVGIALFLSHLARSGKSASQLRARYPNYHISKNKIELTAETDVDHILLEIREKYKRQPVNIEDGVKIEFDREWVHLRRSNTEPIIRIYAESSSEATADYLANKIISDIREIISQFT